MQIRTRTGKRKAISPVLATVILIAITLIAAIAVAGFVFGLFGTFTSTARVSAAVTYCQWVSGTGTTCYLNLSNSGTSNTASTVCSMIYGGVTYPGVVAGAGTISAGKTTAANCLAASGPDPGAGVAITGSLSTSNGASVPFTSTSSN
jgi:flagellin-like protein